MNISWRLAEKLFRCSALYKPVLIIWTYLDITEHHFYWVFIFILSQTAFTQVIWFLLTLLLLTTLRMFIKSDRTFNIKWKQIKVKITKRYFIFQLSFNCISFFSFQVWLAFWQIVPISTRNSRNFLRLSIHIKSIYFSKVFFL